MSEDKELTYSDAIQKAGSSMFRFPLISVKGIPLMNHIEREKRNILYIFYEDMKEDPRREVERIMKYMDLSLSDDVVGSIVELTTFKNMKENPMANYTCIPENVFDQSISSFMRKGEVGDWKNHFTPEQSAEFDEDYEKKMKQVNIPFRTQF
uniref:Sulfotransferase n=1 Tax=Hippocampus comes TaxID=109280 RepID=A0A3Q2Z6F1_HIPCM